MKRETTLRDKIIQQQLERIMLEHNIDLCQLQSSIIQLHYKKVISQNIKVGIAKK